MVMLRQGWEREASSGMAHRASGTWGHYSPAEHPMVIAHRPRSKAVVLGRLVGKGPKPEDCNHQTFGYIGYKIGHVLVGLTRFPNHLPVGWREGSHRLPSRGLYVWWRVVHTSEYIVIIHGELLW